MTALQLDRDRFRGALLGLAVCDALGTTVEFKPPGSFPPVSDITGGGPFRLPKGSWTDDTSMALCLGESLIACTGFDPKDQLQRYVAWYRRGHLSSTGECFDIGGATSAALNRFERLGEPYPGDAFPDAGGNGTLMRLAPVVMAYAAHPEAAIARAGDSARTTHGHTPAIDATRLMAAMLLAALHGADGDAVLSGGPHARLAGDLTSKVQEIADGSFRGKRPPAIRGDGYAPLALEAALWALHTTDDFAAGALAAVNLGDDADTTGAIYGQLAGAHYGIDAIPAHWREVVTMGEEITAMADDLYDLAQRIDPDAGAAPARGGAGRSPRRPRSADTRRPATPNGGPLEDVYWVEEDRIAAGPYAGAPTKAEAAAKLNALLDLGVRTFVDLTEERDRYMELEPYSHLLKTLSAERGVVTTHLRLPIDDTDVPPRWRMRVILDAIETASAAGEVVYVHCWGGIGRTGTVVGCLPRERGTPPADVLDRLQSLRAHTPRGRTRTSPERGTQVDFVTGWTPGEGRAPIAGSDASAPTPASAPAPAIRAHDLDLLRLRATDLLASVDALRGRIDPTG